MGFLDVVKNVWKPKSYPKTEFGMDDMQFFVALLRACPEGSRLSFDHSEPESFVHTFREWSHRDRPDTFEAEWPSEPEKPDQLSENPSGYCVNQHRTPTPYSWKPHGYSQLRPER